jgi:signal peptidase I
MAVVTSYTFKQNYYWMMGDNRHNSEDSRWGFVPEDHIVGKPIYLDEYQSRLTTESKLHPGIELTTVSGEGQPQSYFKYFLFALAAYFIENIFGRASK